jgi:hypothetical protein
VAPFSSINAHPNKSRYISFDTFANSNMLISNASPERQGQTNSPFWDGTVWVFLDRSFTCIIHLKAADIYDLTVKLVLLAVS